MTALCITLAVVALSTAIPLLVLLFKHPVKAWWYRIFRDPEPRGNALDCGCTDRSVMVGCLTCSRMSCPAHQAHDHDEPGPCIVGGSDLVERAYTDAGDTFGFQRTSYYIDGGHPKDCTEKCCFEIRLTELHDAFDWHAAEHEMRSKR